MEYLWIILTVSIVITAEEAFGQRYDHCNNVHCHNGGTCESHSGHASCKCTHAYTGRHCETLIDHCSSYPCQHGGRCSNHVSVHSTHQHYYHCECQTGWMGTSCETADPCTNNPCHHGGTCKHSTYHHHSHGYYCECKTGFDGNNCETAVSVMSDQCGSNPCKNGASCENTSDGYKCKCPSNWSGQQCDQDIDECVLYHFCQNGATCVNTPGSFNCTCAAGFTGTQCGQAVSVTSDQCGSNPCKNGATCENTSDGYKCKCPSNWSGQQCDKDIDECVLYHFCQNGATCVNTPGSFNCTCAAGYTGKQCAQVPNMCDSQPCRNGAPCHGNSTYYSCQCQQGFVGKDCDKQDLCIFANPCKNGATCTSDPSGQVTCSCMSGYYGVNCEKGQPNTCDHLCTLQSAVSQHSMQSTNAATCPNSTSFASNEALPMYCCQTQTSNYWKKGLNVMAECNSGSMIAYTVVAMFKADGTVKPDSSGILTECQTDGTGFKMIRQDCATTPTLVHVNGAIAGSNPDHYFIVL